jgi:hypothetical protein
MNVLLVGKFYVEDFALHIAETLSDMGRAVVRFEGPPLSATGTGLGYRISQVRQLIYSTGANIPALRAPGLWQVGPIRRCDGWRPCRCTSVSIRPVLVSWAGRAAR